MLVENLFKVSYVLDFLPKYFWVVKLLGYTYESSYLCGVAFPAPQLNEGDWGRKQSRH